MIIVTFMLLLPAQFKVVTVEVILAAIIVAAALIHAKE